jgi:Protein of unknown function (DUF3551)
MIRILLAASIVIAAAALAPRSAQAAEAPWCAVVGLGPGDVYWDCQYRTLDECIPHVLAGNRGFCNENPRYTGQPKPTQRARRKRHDSQS